MQERRGPRQTHLVPKGKAPREEDISEEEESEKRPKIL